MALHPCRPLAALLAAALAGPGLAADAPSYEALLRQSLDRAPALLEQAADVRAAGAEARQAHAWRNPSFDALAENLGAPRSGGVSQRQDTYTLTQPLELGGKRAARIEAGERALAAAEARAHQTRVDFAALLAVTYATAEAMQARKALAADDLARADNDLRAARALVHAGKEADLRVAQAQASRAAAQAGAQAAEADATEALERLSALAGAEDTYTGIAHPLPLPAATAPASGPAPAVATAEAERDALAAQVRMEQKKRIPDLDLSAGVRRFGWTRDNALVVGLSVSLPLFDPNRGGIAAARERATAAEARLAAARLEADAARRAAQAQAAAADGRLDAAAQGERAAAEAYRLGRIGYQAGKVSLLELLATRRALSEARLATIEARLARVRALAALSRADGRLAFEE
ncbi:TolC family protein [Frateuria defendens]|uniref:TolC family protein n=1 Tax=Frateuria defendens TaxID=2219559 RepID=UPI00066FBF1E|nr:TolC family protein [Frateuria defendens]